MRARPLPPKYNATTEMTAMTNTKAIAPINIDRRDQREAGIATALPDSVSRFSRWRSVRMSEACWYRRFRSFSKHFVTIRSSSAGRSGFSRTGGTGARFRIESKITPELSPRNGNVPVAISYKTAPNENKSVRESSSLARTCSGDM
jgi:hypothetical protein